MTPEQIKSLRQRLGDTQEEFARRLGLRSYTTVWHYERGTRRPGGAVEKILHETAKKLESDID